MGKRRENLNDNHRNNRARDAQIMTLLVCAKNCARICIFGGGTNYGTVRHTAWCLVLRPAATHLSRSIFIKN